MEVAVVVPVLGRPERAQPLAESLFASEGDVRLQLVFVCSPGDPDQAAACFKARANMIEPVSVLLLEEAAGPGDWAKKVNLAYRSTSAEWLLTGADDLRFHSGWAEAALAVAEQAGARVVGTNDLGNPRVKAGKHATHNLVARSYADELGTIDGPGMVVSTAYDHNFVDDELVLTAKGRGEWAFAAGALVEHMHPHWRKAEMDETYAKGLAHFREDQRLFHRRASMIRGARGRRPPVGVEVRGGRWEGRREAR